MIPENESIVELAECIKELVRFFKTCFDPLPPHLEGRLDAVYSKASRAKDRMDV